MNKLAIILIGIFASFSACNKDENPTTISICNTNTSAENGKFGGCVLETPVNSETVDPTDLSITIQQDAEYTPFVKKIQSYGTLFVAMDGVSDDFLRDIVITYQEMFLQDSTFDLVKQQEVLNALQQYCGAIPVFLGNNTNANTTQLEQDCSFCDIIMYRVNGQVMEVIEHLLHNITDVGLHYAYPDEWSFNQVDSEVYQVMKQAIDAGFYDISSYNDFSVEAGCGIYNRIIVQEFAYWLISTYWNLQEPYGPDENEWTIRNRQQLQENLPSGYNLVETTVGRIMTSPSNDILEKLKTYEP